MKTQAFHYAFKVRNLEQTRKFYMDILGCKEGRYTEKWVDFNFFDNQLSAHLSEDLSELDYCGSVDGVSVPIPHFGCLLEEDVFEKIKNNLDRAGIKYIVKPQARFVGQEYEQQTMFILDPSGNPIEFKSFRTEAGVYHAM